MMLLIMKYTLIEDVVDVMKYMAIDNVDNEIHDDRRFS